MKTLLSTLAVLAMCAASGPVPQVHAEEMMVRLSDKDVKALVKTLGQQQKQFSRAVDSKFRRTILRGTSGEIEVDSYLDDLAVSIDRLGKRFTGQYSASTEANEVLKRADAMNTYVRNHPEMKGANEWDVFGSGLQQLARAYGTEFPLPDDATIRRIGDGELADAATATNKFSKSLPKLIRKQTKGHKELQATVKAIEAEAKSMAALSKTLASRIRSGKPASAEARQLIDSANKIDALMDTDGMPEAASEVWSEGQPGMRKIADAFGIDRGA